MGWFVDDIQLVTADWKTIGEPTGTALTVTKETAGTYHYRVGAVYTEHAVGPWSNVASAEVVLQPDLALAAADVTYSTTRVRGGDRVTIAATVRNVGTAAAPAVPVRFTDNGALLAAPTTGPIPAGGSATVTAVWDTKGQNGMHTIEITADPANAVDEDLESNNTVNGVFTVHGNKVKNGAFSEPSPVGCRSGRLDGVEHERRVRFHD